MTTPRAQAAQSHGGIFLFFALLLPLVIFAARAVYALAEPALQFDTQYSYLPLAQRLLGDFGALWHSPDMLKTAPGIIFYMALAGAQIMDIKALNMACALLMFLLLFDAARRTAGYAAAACAAWLLACSPYLAQISTWLMVEPPILFFTALWLWSSVWMVQCQRGWRAFGAVLLAALALAAATLTRATWMYWLVAAPPMFAALAWRDTCRRVAWRRFACVHVIALLCVGSYVLRNALVFDAPLIANGAGAALYFGNNPMTHGQEPPFFAMTHDDRFASDWQFHLSRTGDARLQRVARTIVADMPPATLAALYAKKAVTFLFLSKTHLREDYAPRLWRIALLFCAALGAWQGRKKAAVCLLLCAALYQWLVHIPVLYNPRYSFAALDIALTLLAACGLAGLWQARGRRAIVFCHMGALALCLGAGIWHQEYSRPLMPDMHAVPHRLVQQAAAQDIGFDGLDGNPFLALAESGTGTFSIIWDQSPPALEIMDDSLALLHLKIAQIHGQCTRAWLQYRNTDGAMQKDMMLLHTISAPQELARGILFLKMPGTPHSLRWEFDCTPGTRIRFADWALYETGLGAHYFRKAFAGLPQ